MNKADTPIVPTTGFLRLKQVLQFIPVGKTAWYAGIKEGRFPRPIPLGSRTMRSGFEKLDRELRWT